jgi:hypothetical protein
MFTAVVWTPAQAEGVRSLVSTTQRALQTPAWDAQLVPMRDRWKDTCASLGIILA